MHFFQKFFPNDQIMAKIPTHYKVRLLTLVIGSLVSALIFSILGVLVILQGKILAGALCFFSGLLTLFSDYFNKNIFIFHTFNSDLWLIIQLKKYILIIVNRQHLCVICLLFSDIFFLNTLI